MCLYVSEKFCDRAYVTVKQRMCTPELELVLISVSLGPRYLPREFGRIFDTVVYAAVYDSTSAARAGKAIAAAVRDLQLISADAPCFVLRPFLIGPNTVFVSSSVCWKCSSSRFGS